MSLALHEPKTYNKVLSCEDKNQKLAGMQDEYHSLINNGTWDFVDLPPDRKAIKNKWVFKLK